MVASSQKEINVLREAGKRLAFILNEVAKKALAGVSSLELEKCACRMIEEQGGTSSFKGYKAENDGIAFPSCLCVSINEEIVHGIPYKNKILKDGDLVGLDLGMRWPATDDKNSFFVDAALTVYVGKIDAGAEKLLKAGEKALEIGILEIKVGGHIGDIGEAVERFIKDQKFGVFKELVGHGVGRAVHEDPMVPNWGRKGRGVVIEEGMVLAFEPMITEGIPNIILDSNLWTWKTKDKKRSVHFEHTILATKNGPEILTRI